MNPLYILLLILLGYVLGNLTLLLFFDRLFPIVDRIARFIVDTIFWILRIP